MLEISFLSAELAFTAVWLLVRISIWIRRNSIDWKREAVLLLMYLNLAVIIRFVFFPRDLVDGHVQPLIFETAAVFPLRLNLIPLVRLFDYDNIRDTIWNVVGNMVMFIPIGFCIPLLWRASDEATVTAGFLTSLSIEVIQLFLPRWTDIDDVMLNTIGTTLGLLLYKMLDMGCSQALSQFRIRSSISEALEGKGSCRISMHREIKAPTATTFQNLFNCLYMMGSTMPLGINSTAFPTTFQIISWMLS